MSEPWQKLYKKEVEGKKSENLKEVIPELTISHLWYLRMQVKSLNYLKIIVLLQGCSSLIPIIF